MGNKAIAEYFGMSNKYFFNEYSESFVPPLLYDAVFTCPPYFDTEIYDDDLTSSKKYGEYKDWLDSWWRETVKKSLVNRPKYFAFVINHIYKEDMKRVCEEEGLVLMEETSVGPNQLNHFQRSTTNSYKGEFLLVFKNK